MPLTAETILQFGAGRFLRGFVDRFVQHANDGGQSVGRIVVVQSTPGARADLLTRSGGAYHVVVRGYEDGKLVDRVEPVASVRRALQAQDQWAEVLEVARSPELRWIVTNATESGYKTEPGDGLDAAPSVSMPAKLTRVLWERFRTGGSPLVLLPCELLERNADQLVEIVARLARTWGLPGDFETWLRDRCVWPNSLVDCIIVDGPADHPTAATDPLLITAEPYALWALERPKGGQPALFEHPAIQWVDDLTPYFLRKVRILNGTHTAMAARYYRRGFDTVQQVVADREAARWLRGLIFEETVPAIAHRIDDLAEFADHVWDRFRNPFQAHLLKNILLNHADKVRVRLRTTHEEYVRLFGKEPKRLAEILAMDPETAARR